MQSACCPCLNSIQERQLSCCGLRQGHCKGEEEEEENGRSVFLGLDFGLCYSWQKTGWGNFSRRFKTFLLLDLKKMAEKNPNTPQQDLSDVSLRWRFFIKFPLKHKAFSLSGPNWNYIKCIHPYSMLPSAPFLCKQFGALMCDISKEYFGGWHHLIDTSAKWCSICIYMTFTFFTLKQSSGRGHVRNRKDETKGFWEIKINIMVKFSTNYCCREQLKLVFGCTYLLCRHYG